MVRASLLAQRLRIELYRASRKADKTAICHASLAHHTAHAYSTHHTINQTPPHLGRSSSVDDCLRRECALTIRVKHIYMLEDACVWLLHQLALPNTQNIVCAEYLYRVCVAQIVRLGDAFIVKLISIGIPRSAPDSSWVVVAYLFFFFIVTILLWRRIVN